MIHPMRRQGNQLKIVFALFYIMLCRETLGITFYCLLSFYSVYYKKQAVTIHDNLIFLGTIRNKQKFRQKILLT